MKKTFAAVILVFASLAFTAVHAFAAEAQKSPLLGEWFTDGGESVVQIYKGSDGYCGKIVWLKEPTYPDGTDKQDKHNPDESLRTRKIIGIDIVRGFREKGKNTWTAGTIYDPNDGKSYSCNAKLKGDKLSIRGYIGTPLIGRTTVWKRKI